MEHHFTKMKLLLSSLQLASLCALSSYSVSSLKVIQSEDVTVKEGDTANISCCWTSERERARVQWWKNNKDVSKEFKNGTSKQPVQTDCSFLIIANITQEQSGTYICKVTVDIPMLKQGQGNGTTITVTSKNGTDDQTNNNDGKGDPQTTPLALIVLGVAAPVLLIVLIGFCCLRRRPGHAARVIYEVPHLDSETQEVDKDSTGSRGSSQWCQVPLYEPFVYLEQMEDKKRSG